MNPQQQQDPKQPGNWRNANAGQNYQPVQPLYGTAQNQTHTAPTVHVTPDHDTAVKHQASVTKFPHLRLSQDEYVIEAVRRHPIGMLSIWGMVALLTVIVFGALPLYADNYEGIVSALGFGLPNAAELAIPALILVSLFFLGGFIATVVYQGNRFFLTNESVIQHVKTSLLSDKVQIINLVNVEDASAEQKGIMQQLFGYGTIRLSTQGEETIYHFYYVKDPNHVINKVNDAVEVAMRKLEGDLRMHQIRE